jgi:hypothetical protein
VTFRQKATWGARGQKEAVGRRQWAVGRLRSARCRALWPVSDRATGRDRRSPFLAMAKSAHYGLNRNATDNAGDLRSRPVARSETGHSARRPSVATGGSVGDRPQRATAGTSQSAHCLLPTASCPLPTAHLPTASCPLHEIALDATRLSVLNSAAVLVCAQAAPGLRRCPHGWGPE